MHVQLPKTFHYFPSLLFCFFSFVAGAKGHSAPSLKLYSPYTDISVPPGQTINYTVQVINNSNTIQNADLSVSGLPRSWTHSLTAGGWKIHRIAVLPGNKETVSLQVIVPLQVNKGIYRFTVNAKGLAVLPLTVVISERGTYKTEFTTTQSNLEGAANTTFTFDAKLKNGTADTALYALNAGVPPGWNITFKANYKQVASVSIDPNQTKDITITINPPDQIPAGTYRIPVMASTNETSAGLELDVMITGSYSMALTTTNGLLSTDITAGDFRRMAMIVTNTGSAPLKNVALHFKAPTNWDVTFDPKKIDRLAAGQTAQVFATIKADKHAIAGDYMAEIMAQTPETTSKTELRVSVGTSMLWGWMGVLVIFIALGSVFYLFNKYGRR
jgi:uncharacterized membrane protein